MGKDSAIEWTDHTFNPWWGCSKVSPACDHCYAEAFAKRTGHGVWGKKAPRRFFGDNHWNEPYKWDMLAHRVKERRRVFCASMADVFEDREDLAPHRRRLWNTIRRTPNLDWLLLTKRPENIERMVPLSWLRDPEPNVWYGTTAENQGWWDKRIPYLLKVPAERRFVSMEPLLGPVRIVGDLMGGFDPGKCGSCGHGHGFTRCPNYGGISRESTEYKCDDFRRVNFSLDWIIVGGESGPGARPSTGEWFDSITEQCARAAVPVFVKQLGRILLTGETATVGSTSATQAERFRDRKGGDPEEWPEEFRLRQFPAEKR